MTAEDELGERMLGCAMKVHTGLGPGLLESAYERCLDYELHQQGIKATRQVVLALRYGDVDLDAG